MSLRVATIADIESMHRIRLAVRENRLKDLTKVQYDDYRRMFETHGCCWVYELDAEVVGFAIADAMRRNVWALFVAPGFEGRGIGRSLHDAVVNRLFEMGPQPIWLTTEGGSRAESFYVMAGWIRSGVVPSGEIRFEMTGRSASGCRNAVHPGFEDL